MRTMETNNIPFNTKNLLFPRPDLKLQIFEQIHALMDTVGLSRIVK